MNFSDVQAILASRGLTGVDAETAFRHWQINPRGSDACRVQRILEVEGLL